MEREDEDRILPLEAPPSGSSGLPYTIEVWDLARTRPDRVLGRAASMVLARAVFTAALSEHLGRKVVLRRGSKVVAQSD
jgi:hypothetical protein